MKNFAITICLMFVVSGFVFATGGGQGQGQEQDQIQGQGQIQGQIIENVGNTGDSHYDSKAPGVAPYQVGHIWQMPTKNNLWNDLAVDPRILEGPWKMEEVVRALKAKSSAKNGQGLGKKSWFGLGGARGDTIASFPRLADPTQTIDFKDASSMTIAQLTKDYHFIGVVNVRADKELSYFLGLMHGLKVAMDNGGQLAVLSGGMNTIYHSSSSGLGLSGLIVGSSSSGSGGTGVASGNGKAEGESAVRLAVFVKNGVEESAVADQPAEEESVELVEIETEVNPEILVEAVK